MLVVAAIVLGLSIWLSQYYITGAREIKRLESVSKNLIFEQFSSALAGLSTIRAFDNTSIFVDRMCGHIDNFTRTFWHIYVTNR